MQPANNRIFIAVSSETGESVQDVAQVHKACFGFIAETIKSGLLQDIMLPYLGKFEVHHKLIHKTSFKTTPLYDTIGTGRQLRATDKALGKNSTSDGSSVQEG